MCGKFDSLCLATGKSGCRLPQPEIAESDVVEHSEARCNPIYSREEKQSFADGHTQDIGDGLSFVPDFEETGLESRTLALLTYELYIGQELHFLDFDSVSFAAIAAAAGYVKAEVGRVVAPGLGLASGSE